MITHGDIRVLLLVSSERVRFGLKPPHIESLDDQLQFQETVIYINDFLLRRLV